MLKSTESKVRNLRAIFPKDGMSYRDLMSLTAGNKLYPSYSTLKKYGLLEVLREETYEEVMTQETAELFGEEQLTGWGWFPEDCGWTYVHGYKIYGLT